MLPNLQVLITFDENLSVHSVLVQSSPLFFLNADRFQFNLKSGMFIDFEQDTVHDCTCMCRVDVCKGVCKGRVSNDRNKDELRAMLTICRTLLFYFSRNLKLSFTCCYRLADRRTQQLSGVGRQRSSAGRGCVPQQLAAQRGRRAAGFACLHDCRRRRLHLAAAAYLEKHVRESGQLAFRWVCDDWRRDVRRPDSGSESRLPDRHSATLLYMCMTTTLAVVWKLGRSLMARWNPCFFVYNSKHLLEPTQTLNTSFRNRRVKCSQCCSVSDPLHSLSWLAISSGTDLFILQQRSRCILYLWLNCNVVQMCCFKQ